MTFTLEDIGVLIAIFGSIFTGLWFLLNWVFFKPMKDNIKNIDSKLEQAKEKTVARREECSNKFTHLSHVEVKVNDIKENIESLSNRIEQTDIFDLSESVNIIAKWVMKFDPSTIDLLAKRSPYRILPIGYEVLQLSQAKKCVDENFDFFKDYINKQRPETAYDVENIATMSASASMSQSFMNPVKDFLYATSDKIDVEATDDTGTPIKREINISPLLIHQLAGVYIRDKYLELFEGNKGHFYFE